jgi:hypothetical protein
MAQGGECKLTGDEFMAQGGECKLTGGFMAHDCKHMRGEFMAQGGECKLTGGRFVVLSDLGLEYVCEDG